MADKEQWTTLRDEEQWTAHQIRQRRRQHRYVVTQVRRPSIADRTTYNLIYSILLLSPTANVLLDEELRKSRQRAAGKMPQDTAGNASDDAAQPGKEGVKLWSDGFLQSRIKKKNDESWQVESSLESSLESSHIADTLDKLRGIPEREAGGEQLDARVAELIDELEEHMAKLEEEKARLLHMAVAFGPLT